MTHACFIRHLHCGTSREWGGKPDENWWEHHHQLTPVAQRRKPRCRHNPCRTGFIFSGFCLCCVSVIRERNYFFTCFRKLHIVLESLKILSSMTFLCFKSPVSLFCVKRSFSLIYFLFKSMKAWFAIHHLFITNNAALLMSSL